MQKQSIRQLRETNGLSREQLSEALGVAPASIYFWESGRNMPDVLTLRRIARLFDLSGVDEIALVGLDCSISGGPILEGEIDDHGRWRPSELIQPKVLDPSDVERLVHERRHRRQARANPATANIG